MEKYIDFDPNAPGVDNGSYFGLPYDAEDSEIVLLPVPWDVTTSYMDGTSNAPEFIRQASLQVDLHDENVPDAWRVRIATSPVDQGLKELNSVARKKAERVIEVLSDGGTEESVREDIDEVNRASAEMNRMISERTGNLIGQGKIVGLVGGDHSVPLGHIKQLGEIYDNFGVLHIDAHADLRDAYEGFTYSHASIMYNVLKSVPSVKTLCQVGVRDFSSQESRLIENDDRIESFTDTEMKRAMFGGVTWRAICDQIISSLPYKVYISFDIDGLSPDLCPSTGTPVAGGLTFREADYLLYKLATSGREIIGFDLCEVGGEEWDSNVGSRVLYKLALYTHLSRKK